MTIILDGTTGITTPAINSSGDLELPGGTANGVLYLNGSKVATSGSALVFDGTNLGVGVTPSAWGTTHGGTVLQTGVGASFFGRTDNADTYIGTNLYRNSAGDWKYLTSAPAGYYQLSQNTHIWNIAASGTAGNTITFTQAMTLDASGNLGVGVTSPNGKLSVAGNITLEPGGSGPVASSRPQLWRGADGLLGIQSGADTSGLIVFYTGSSGTPAERARITAGGYAKFSNNGTYVNASASFHEFRSTTSDNEIIQITHTASSNPYGQRIKYTASSPNDTSKWFLYCDDSTTLRAEIRSNGGLANYQSNNADLSDERTKKDITPAPSYWDKIGALEIVTYKYNDQTHDDVNVGVIAQQVEAVEPVWVDSDGFGETPEGEEPFKTVYTKDITFAAIKALQEAMTRIENLEAEVSALKGV